MSFFDKVQEAEGQKPNGTSTVISTPGKSGKPTDKAVTTERVNESVRIMQRMMSDLQTQLGIPANRDIIVSYLKENNPGKQTPTKEQIEQKIKGISSTGSGQSGSLFDGIWGPKTKAALDQLKTFISLIPGANLSINSGNGPNPYKAMNKNELDTAATANIVSIYNLFGILGLKSSVQLTRKPSEGAKDILDKIQSSLTSDAMTAPMNNLGNVIVSERDLSDLFNFFNLITTLKLEGSQCKALAPIAVKAFSKDTKIEKLAKFILDNTLFTLSDVSSFINKKAQDADIKTTIDENIAGVFTGKDPFNQRKQEKQTGTAAGQAAATSVRTQDSNRGDSGEIAKQRQKEWNERQQQIKELKTKPQSETFGTSICFNVIEDFIIWFVRRSFSIHKWLNDNTPNTNPLTQNPISKTDLENASKYKQLTNGLFSKWESIKSNIENQITDRSNPQVNIKMLMRAGVKSSENSPGSGMGTGGIPGVSGAPGIGSTSTRIPGSDYAQASEAQRLQGPLAYEMNLYETFRIYGDFITSQSQMLQNATLSNVLPHINLKNWRRGDWKQIARRNIKDKSISAKYKRFRKFADALEDFLIDLLNNWKEEYSGKVSDSIIEQQERLLSQWQNAIQGQKDFFTRTNSQAIKEAEEEEGISRNSHTSSVRR